MRVLVACEYSGRVRDAFIKRGHEAMSCDLLPTDVPGPHYQGDVFDVINDGWDLMIAHPPCTYLTCSAEWAYKDPDFDRYPGVGYHQRVKPGTLTGEARRRARYESITFVKKLAAAQIRRKAIENPRASALAKTWRPADQSIQPYDFGEDASKITGLWLDGLKPLKPTKYHPARMVCGCGHTYPEKPGLQACVCPNCAGKQKAVARWGNQTDSGQNKIPPGADRWKKRSVTWQGWADAMAEQWG